MDTEGQGLPIKVDSTSNGEYAPQPVGRTLSRAKEIAQRRITENARRVGQSRRRFLTGICGAATTLFTLNQAFAARGNTGGVYRVPTEGSLDPEVATAALGGGEFIVDAQTHLVEPDAPWRNGPSAGWARALARWPQGGCGEADPVDCYDRNHFVREVFLGSDTDMALLSFVPAPPGENPLSMAEAARARALVAGLDGTDRLLLHTMVVPNWPPFAAQLAAMEEVAAAYPIAAWKTYTGWGPGGRGWRLDDPEIGIPFLEKARELGIRTVCIHKGLPFSNQDRAFATCDDIGPAAALFPDVTFVIYHSGYEAGRREGPFEGGGARRGVDTLVRSLRAHGIPAGANVYAELGSTWRILMRDPTAAAHTLGKLMSSLGTNRLLWGTDSIWYGSPQDQIEAFRAFEIAEQLAERHGYPQLTPDVKARIFGLNAAELFGIDGPGMRRRAESDRLGEARRAYAEAPAPSLRTYGPRTPSEFRTFQRLAGPGPG